MVKVHDGKIPWLPLTQRTRMICATIDRLVGWDLVATKRQRTALLMALFVLEYTIDPPPNIAVVEWCH